MTEAWGTERIRQRGARRRKRIVRALVGLALVSLLVPFATGVFDGFRSAHAGTDAAALKPYIGFGVALAGAGVTALLLLPLLTAGQALFGIESPAMLAWAAALGTAIGLFVLRRWCG